MTPSRRNTPPMPPMPPAPPARLAAAALACALALPTACAPERDRATAAPAGAVSAPVNLPVTPVEGPLRPAPEEPSDGATLTFLGMGSPGWYPSRRDPAQGSCGARNQPGCCMERHDATGPLAPWDEELILTLRGPMLLRTFAVYQPAPGDTARWSRVSLWEEGIATSRGTAFDGSGATSGGTGFTGRLGNKCLVDVSSDKPFPCGPGSVPYCPGSSAPKRRGWEGSKLILLQASMPRMGDAVLAGAGHCSTDPADNWFDAPWIGLSHGELIRSGKFGDCNCYAKDPAKWWLGDGCGQFNAFEVVNDNNAYRNLTVFSTNFFAYHGNVGEGPCGPACDPVAAPADADLVVKSTGRAAQAGALAGPGAVGPGAAFRRPASGWRWFVLLLDARARTVQLALLHPENLPPASRGVLPALPAEVPRAAVLDLLRMRLPAPAGTGIRRP